MSTSASYPIRAVARLTGISIDTLRAWERRYEAVVPDRGDRGRLYRDVHITRLRQLDALVRAGHAIGSIARLSDRALARLLNGSRIPDPGPGSRSIDGQVDLARLMAALDGFDLEAIDGELNRFAAFLPAPTFVLEVAMPLLREMGDRWEAGTLRPAHEHLISSMVRTVLGGLLRTTARGSGRGAVVFATLQGERHELGVLAGAVLAAHAGHPVIYLGPDLPAEDIAATARITKASAIVVSATATTPRAQIARLGKLLPKVMLIVGGSRATQASRGVSGAVCVDDLHALVPLLSTWAR